MCPSNGTTNGAAKDIHSTGQPDTPIEVITDLLQKAMQQDSLDATKTLVDKALQIAAGLDSYLEHISSKPSQVAFAPKSQNSMWV